MNIIEGENKILAFLHKASSIAILLLGILWTFYIGQTKKHMQALSEAVVQVIDESKEAQRKQKEYIERMREEELMRQAQQKQIEAQESSKDKQNENTKSQEKK